MSTSGVEQLQQGSIGIDLIIRCVDESGSPEDVSSATTKQIKIKDPNGNTSTNTASFVTDGRDGKIVYTTVSGDLDTVGTYQLMGKIITLTKTLPTRVGQFEVEASL